MQGVGEAMVPRASTQGAVDLRVLKAQDGDGAADSRTSVQGVDEATVPRASQRGAADLRVSKVSAFDAA